MKTLLLETLLLATLLFASCPPALKAQQVRLAKVGLGMSEAEIKEALFAAAPHYTDRASPVPAMHSLLAVTEEEAYLFTFAGDKAIAFSLVHLIGAGQQPFLPAGQEPTVKTLRDLVIKQTWAPAKVSAGDTFWLSDATGAPLSTVDACKPNGSAAGWKPLAPTEGGNGALSAGLMEPVLINYPINCGVSIHLSESPASTENERVSKVEIQVVDLKAINAVAQNSKRQ